MSLNSYIIEGRLDKALEIVTHSSVTYATIDQLSKRKLDNVMTRAEILNIKAGNAKEKSTYHRLLLCRCVISSFQ